MLYTIVFFIIAWEITVITKEFGTKTKAEAFGRIVSHTAYHAGQLAIIHKYGHYLIYIS